MQCQGCSSSESYGNGITNNSFTYWHTVGEMRYDIKVPKHRGRPIHARAATPLPSYRKSLPTFWAMSAKDSSNPFQRFGFMTYECETTPAPLKCVCLWAEMYRHDQDSNLEPLAYRANALPVGSIEAVWYESCFTTKEKVYYKLENVPMCPILFESIDQITRFLIIFGPCHLLGILLWSNHVCCFIYVSV